MELSGLVPQYPVMPQTVHVVLPPLPRLHHTLMHANSCMYLSTHPLHQVSYLLSGLFARACKSLGSSAGGDQVGGILGEVTQLRGLLTNKLAQINSNLEGE